MAAHEGAQTRQAARLAAGGAATSAKDAAEKELARRVREAALRGDAFQKFEAAIKADINELQRKLDDPNTPMLVEGAPEFGESLVVAEG